MKQDTISLTNYYMEHNYNLFYHYVMQIYQYICTNKVDKYDDDLLESLAVKLTPNNPNGEQECLDELNHFKNIPSLDSFSVGNGKDSAIKLAKEIDSARIYSVSNYMFLSAVVETILYQRLQNVANVFMKQHKGLRGDYFELNQRLMWHGILFKYLKDVYVANNPFPDLNPEDIEIFEDGSYLKLERSFSKLNGKGVIRLNEEQRYPLPNKDNGLFPFTFPDQYSEELANKVISDIKLARMGRINREATLLIAPSLVLAYIQNNQICLITQAPELVDSYKRNLPDGVQDSVSVVLNLGNLIKKYVTKYASDEKSEKSLPVDLKQQILEDIEEDTALF